MTEVCFWLVAITFAVGFDVWSDIEVVWWRIPAAVMFGLLWWLWMILFLVFVLSGKTDWIRADTPN